jgi:hypothetical protein
MLVGMEVVQGREKGGENRKGGWVTRPWFALSFFPSFVYLHKFTCIFKNSYTSIILHGMKWPYMVMHSHIHIWCYIDLNIIYTLTWRVNKYHILFHLSMPLVCERSLLNMSKHMIPPHWGLQVRSSLLLFGILCRSDMHIYEGPSKSQESLLASFLFHPPKLY